VADRYLTNGTKKKRINCNVLLGELEASDRGDLQ
jgi:hypothetical protein